MATERGSKTSSEDKLEFYYTGVTRGLKLFALVDPIVIREDDGELLIGYLSEEYFKGLFEMKKDEEVDVLGEFHQVSGIEVSEKSHPIEEFGFVNGTLVIAARDPVRVSDIILQKGRIIIPDFIQDGISVYHLAQNKCVLLKLQNAVSNWNDIRLFIDDFFRENGIYGNFASETIDWRGNTSMVRMQTMVSDEISVTANMLNQLHIVFRHKEMKKILKILDEMKKRNLPEIA